jgi:YidC/Oxa1 family membrane protein insertase
MDQRRMLLAVVLSVTVVLLYNQLVVRRRQPPPAVAPDRIETPTTLASPTAPAEPAQAQAQSGELGYLSCEVDSQPPVVVETDVWRATIAPRGARLMSVRLKQFRQTVHPDSPPLELIQLGPLLPLTMAFDGSRSDAAIVYRPSAASLTLSGNEGGEIAFTGTTESGLAVEKRLRFLGNSYLVDVDVRVTGPDAPKRAGLVLPELEREGIQTSGGSATEAAVILGQGKLTETHIDVTKIHELKTEERPDARWAGLSVPFFVGVVVDPDDVPRATAIVERVGSKATVRLDRPVSDGRAAFKLFLGPKAKEILADAGYELSRLLDFGWFWFIAIPMLYALRLLHRLTANYGIDIILLTALVRVATIPLTQKSFRSMREMQKIQPQLKKIQEQYKDDQAKLQKEMMELYKSHGVNPFGGCAPMILQIPIFVGLYNALLHAIELRHAPFALWITDLSAPERFMVVGVPVPIMTLLMGGSMIVQQWLTPQQGVDPTQRQMMMLMPLFMTYMFLNFPSGLVLYWLVSNLLGIAQQYLMMRSPKVGA